MRCENSQGSTNTAGTGMKMQSWRWITAGISAVASGLIVPIAFGQIALTTAQIAKRGSPSVVVIHGKTDSGDILGSGFIVSKDGKIVTNQIALGSGRS